MFITRKTKSYHFINAQAVWSLAQLMKIIKLNVRKILMHSCTMHIASFAIQTKQYKINKTKNYIIIMDKYDLWIFTNSQQMSHITQFSQLLNHKIVSVFFVHSQVASLFCWMGKSTTHMFSIDLVIDCNQQIRKLEDYIHNNK